jgi:hypothetical protein
VVEGASVTGPSAVLWVSQLNATGRFEAGLGAGLVVGLGLSTWMWLGLLREHGRLYSGWMRSRRGSALKGLKRPRRALTPAFPSGP